MIGENKKVEEDFELILFDRINIIKDIVKKYGEEKFYISFSGGKDSTILHYLIDLALPNNKIPRVFINTGIEYNDIINFVKELSKDDNRFVIIQPKQNIKQVLEKNGYPFKSKQHSHNVAIYQHSGINHSVKRYLGIIESNTLFRCPKMLEYQFTNNCDIKISDKCCLKLKKEPIKQWEKTNNKSIAILGIRQSEGGQRASHKGCIIFDKRQNIIKFKPLNPINDKWEDWFIKEKNIRLCKLYYEPFNFKRTGCKGCPFSIDLQKQLEVMEQFLPNEAKQCELIWKPIYEEYRRLNYRLKEYKNINLFDFDFKDD